MPVPALSLRAHPAFRSQFLPDDRDVTVFLPPGYDDAGATRYPVLYLHDGQNLFDPETAFKKGEHWRIGETATALIDAGRIEPLIIVGIANTGPRRIEEYAPTYDRRRGGGEAHAYGRLIVEELKPFTTRPIARAPRQRIRGSGGRRSGRSCPCMSR